MWFGTDDGLNRFDGHQFRIYRYNSYDPESLPNDRIISLFEDSTGRIWVCTYSHTCYYDYQTDAFHPLTFSDSNNTPEYFQQIREDKKGNLWLMSYNRIARYALSGESSPHFYPEGEQISLIDITMDEENEPILAGHNDLFFYKPEADKFVRIPVLTEKEKGNPISLTRLCLVPDWGILIGTDRAGLKFYDRNSRNTETIIPDIQVRDIKQCNENTYWIASESGVYILNMTDRSITHLQKSLTNEYTISDNAVYSITKDREGGIWVTTFFGGINYLPKEYIPFKYFIGGKTHPGMPGNAVREICPDQYGNLWLGTEDNGINRYSPATGEITNFSRTNPAHPLSATNIHGLLADDSRLWVGTFNTGIDLLDIPSGKIIKRYTRSNTDNLLPSDFILCFCKLSEDEILIGTSEGLVLFRKKEECFIPWGTEIKSMVRQIYKDSKGDIWMATTSGAYRYSKTEKKFAHYTSNRERSQTIGDNNVTSIFEDSKNRIWVATVYGFSLYNEISDSFNRITVENGLPSNIVHRILEDDEHFFWIATANGLVRFNPETYVMKTFSYTDGLPEAQFNYCSAYKMPDGTMYMGTINGMIAFNPRDFKEDVYSPSVCITRIDVQDDRIGAPKYNVNRILESGELKLPHNRSTFTLSYVALSYTSPDAIQYAYRLDGSDKDWIYIKQNKDVTFANLSPGDYVFRVKSTNSSGVWQDNETTLRITVTPPFWATGWAYLIYFLTVCLLIVLWYYYKKAKLEEKHRINREIFETKKEKELYDAKIQFFTFITHEIRTPLTLIKAPLEKILRSGDGTPATQENLRIIEKNTGRLLDLSNQLLDFRKTESRGFKLNYVTTDVVLWLETILHPFRPAFEQGNKHFTVKLPELPFEASLDREAFSKIVSNLVSNALKYSDSRISLELLPPSGEERMFTLLVTNDGHLIPDSETENIFNPFYRLKETENRQGSGIGLSLAHSLAEFHRGRLFYRQTPDGLNQFVLKLPEQQEDSYRIAAGNEKEKVEMVTLTETGKSVILIVEDQDDMRHFIARELAEMYQVVEAENGKVALDLVRKNTVNLIISDVMMPIMDGFELCNEVKNDVNVSHIPFILLTAQHNLQSRLKGLNTGADAYMEKPFSIELLTAQVSNLLKSRELLNKTYLEKPFAPVASLAVSQVDDIFLHKLNDYLEENLSNETLSVEMLADTMGMSTSSLYRKVKGLSGLSPNDFIRIARLKKAILLMQNGENRISEIAFQVGFSSPAYFSTCFQKQYGKTPSEYLKQAGTK
jgi:signal transduction histidine kinase/ligand-binding sensor domain-containing protein/DNA-binding response OmpR family regulator